MDTDEETCPLCMTDFDGIDKAITSCTRCRYQICRFCWFRIAISPSRICPGCRGELLQIQIIVPSLQRADPQSALPGLSLFQTHYSEVHSQFLSALAYFKPDTEIPMRVIQNAGIADPAEAMETFRQQLLVVINQNDSFSIREETQNEIRRCFPQEDGISYAFQILGVEYKRKTFVRNLAVINMTVPHSKTVWRHIAENREYAAHFGRYPSHIWACFFQQAQLEECLSWAKELDKTTSVVYGPYDQEFLNGKLRVGIGLLRLSRFNEAHAILHQTFQVCLRDPNLKMYLTLTCGSFLGLTLTEMAQPEEALKLFDRMMLPFRSLPIHPSVFGLKLRKGITLSRLGRDAEALVYFQECAKYFRDLHNGPSWASSNSNQWVAHTLCRLGKLEEAFDLYAEVYVTEKNIMRPNHPSLSTTIVGLSTILLKIKDFKEAFRLCSRRLNKIKDGQAIEDIYAILEVQEGMARVLLAQKRVGMAKAILRLIYKKRIKLHGERHILTWMAKLNYDSVESYW